jgi:hypothetical protein
VTDNLCNLAFKLIVVLLNLVQPRLLVTLQLFVDPQDALGLLLLCRNHLLQNGDLIGVVSTQICLPLSVGLPFLEKLIVVE